MAAAPLALPARVLGRAGHPGPNEQIGAAIIGLGDRGRAHIRGLHRDVRIVAVCDVDRSMAEAAAHEVAQAYGDAGTPSVQDYRRLLDMASVEAVFIAAPEHWHAKMSIDALRAGRDVFCEKALALTVEEGRAICRTVEATGRVFQAGTQQRSDANFRFACELALNGHLGRLQRVCVGVPGGRALGVLSPAPVPPTLEYDLWLGPAPFRPYREGLCRFNWYFISDYCAGWIQSWGVHHMDIALWGAPALASGRVHVAGWAVFPDEGDADTSISWNVTFRKDDASELLFCSDNLAPHDHGVRFEGDRGWVHVIRGGIRADPPDLLRTRLRPADVRLRVSKDHQTNFLECVRRHRPAAVTAPAEACQRATAATLVADIATRLRRPLTWDWDAERFVEPDANRLLGRAPRSPWHL